MSADRARVGIFTVVERELVRLGRRWQTMFLRAGFAALLFVGVGMVLAGQKVFEGAMAVGALSRLGPLVFWGWAGSLLGAAVLVTPVLVGQAVIDERDEQTLELLAMTRLTPRAILLGKLLSRLIVMESLVLATLPVLALALSFGGVAPGALLGVFVLVNLQMAIVGVAAMFHGLYARSVVESVMQTWSWLLALSIVGSVAGALGLGMRGAGALLALAQPWTAVGWLFESAGSLLYPIVVTPLLWLPGLVLGVVGTERAFATLALGSRQATEEDELLSTAVRPMRRFTGRVLAAGVALAIATPFLFALRELGVLPGWLQEVLGLVYLGASLGVAGTLLLLFTRRMTLRRNQKALGPKVRTSWEKLTEFHEREDALQASRALADPPDERPDAAAALSRRRKGRLLSPLHRQVWDLAIVWRESVTLAHGRLRRGLLGFYIGIGAVWAMAVMFGAFGEATAGIGLAGLAFVPLLGVLLMTSSIVGERQAGTLELLAVTPLAPARILRDKLLGVLLLLAPALGAGLLSTLAVALKSREEIAVLATLLWFLAASAALTMAAAWQALRVENPSRAWAWNVVGLGVLAWLLGSGSAMSVALGTFFSPAQFLWGLAMPLVMIDQGPRGAYAGVALLSTAFWSGGALFFTGLAVRTLRRRVGEG